MEVFKLLFVDATCVTTSDSGWGRDGGLHVEQLCLLHRSQNWEELIWGQADLPLSVLVLQ